MWRCISFIPYSGTLDAILKMIRYEGFYGFYKGMSTKIVQSVLAAAVLFMVKEELVRGARFLLSKDAINTLKSKPPWFLLSLFYFFSAQSLLGVIWINLYKCIPALVIKILLYSLDFLDVRRWNASDLFMQYHYPFCKNKWNQKSNKFIFFGIADFDICFYSWHLNCFF